MFRVWSINTKNNKMLWMMGEYNNIHDAMKRAEDIVFDANPDIEELRFEQTCVRDKRTEVVQEGVMCISHDETVGSVITGITTDHLDNMGEWPGYEREQP